MKNGICPHCGGKDIWKSDVIGQDPSFLSVTYFNSVGRLTYCCIECGLTQSFITQESLDNQAKMEKLRSNFTKVK